MSRSPAWRDEFVAQLTRELPTQSPYAVAELAEQLMRASRRLQRLAELACSSEAADRDRVLCPAATKKRAVCLCDYDAQDPINGHQTIPRIALQDWQTEQRVKALCKPYGLEVLTQGDPRGAVLRVIPPSYAKRNEGKDRFNLEGIAVPS